MPRIALFTDTLFFRSSDGVVFPARDRFPQFIARLSQQGFTVEMLARCGVAERGQLGLDPIGMSDSFSFTPLPFYRDTEGFYRGLPAHLARGWPALSGAVRTSDVVLLRVHNSWALPVAIAAARWHRPLVMYWAGPPITESVARNYPLPSLKHRLARVVAGLEVKAYKLLAAKALWHFVVDRNEADLMGLGENLDYVVPNLVDAAEICTEPSHRRAGAPLEIVYAGRIVQHKGVVDLLSACEAVRQRGTDVRLLFAGDGPASRELRGLAVRAKAWTEFLGAVPPSQLRERLRQAHVLALPSYAEGMPKVIWEGWAAGLAIVVTPVGAIPDYVVDGANGLLIAPGDRSSLSEALHVLAVDETLRSRIARGGISTVRTYSWGSETGRIASRLHELVGGRAQ